ncbi:MAG TPA: ATP-binding protein, partial [Polyangia bacterium]
MEREGERPTSFAVFVGRAVELARLTEMVAQVPATIVVGVPGVGKSALALAFAARWPGVVVRQRVSDAPIAAQLDDVRRQLARDVVDELASDEERAADVARRLAAASGLWLLDDFHRFGDDDQARLLEAFTAAAGSARLVATSRQAPPPRAALADHAQLRLEPLDEAAGRTLWAALDELYGPSDRFDVAWRRSHGLPLLLRQAHAGGFDQADPIEGTVRALDEDERWLAGALALAEVPLPAESLLALRPGARPALRRLLSRFVVDIDGAGACTLHDLFAAKVRAALADDERRTLHVVVAHALARLPLDPAIRVRNVCAHLGAAGRAGEAADWLVQQAGELVRRGSAAELLRAIDTIAPERRPLPLRVERARALLRVLDVGRALAELRALAAGSHDASEVLTISLAQVALLPGDARLARDRLDEIVRRPEVSRRFRARGAVTLAVASSYLGDGDYGRLILANLEPELGDSEQAAVLASYRAFTLWLEERDDEASDAVRMMTLPPAAPEPSSFRAAVIPAIFGSIAARQGRLDDAERALARSQKVLSRRADALFQL